MKDHWLTQNVLGFGFDANFLVAFSFPFQGGNQVTEQRGVFFCLSSRFLHDLRGNLS